MPGGVHEGSGRQRKKLREAARLWALGELGTRTEQDSTNAHVDEALAAFGLYAEAPLVQEDPDFYLWPEHLVAFSHFIELRTQWRIGMEGPTGLDYTAVLAHLRQVGGPRQEARRLYTEIRELESGALLAYREMRANRGEQ